MVRAGFRMLLAREPDIEVVAEAGTGHEAVHETARFAPTVVVMGIRMPRADVNGGRVGGIVNAQRVSRRRETVETHVVHVGDGERASRCSRRVEMHVPRHRPLAETPSSTAWRPRGGSSRPTRVIRQYARLQRPPPPEELHELTTREREVFRLIALGLSTRRSAASSTYHSCLFDTDAAAPPIS